MLNGIRHELTRLSAVDTRPLGRGDWQLRAAVNDAKAGIVATDFATLLGGQLDAAVQRAAQQAAERLEAEGKLVRLRSGYDGVRLTRASFDLNDGAPTVTVAADYSKRRREDTLPLRPVLVTELRAHVLNKLPGALAFNVPKDRKSAAKMFRADTDAAGIAFRDEVNEVIDFHALRRTFITNLARPGVHPKSAQTLARHSTITLTMDKYSHT